MADYIDRRTALKALDDFAKSSQGTETGTIALTMAALGKAVLENVSGPWVSVKEELPRPGKEVICLCTDDNTGEKAALVAFRSKLYWNAGEWVGIRKTAHVTHWMELPDALEEEK